MKRFLRTRRVACLGACALGLVLLSQGRAAAQRMLRPAHTTLQPQPAQLRPPQRNNYPGLASDGLLAPFSPLAAGGGGVAAGGGNPGVGNAGVGNAMNGAQRPTFSGQGQAGVAGLPGGGLGQYSALNPFNNQMGYNQSSQQLYAAYGGYPPPGAYPYGGFNPYGGFSPYGPMPYPGMMPYGGVNPYAAFSPYGAMNPYAAFNPYNNMGMGGMNMMGMGGMGLGGMNMMNMGGMGLGGMGLGLGALNAPFGGFNPGLNGARPAGAANPLGL